MTILDAVCSAEPPVINQHPHDCVRRAYDVLPEMQRVHIDSVFSHLLVLTLRSVAVARASIVHAGNEFCRCTTCRSIGRRRP